MGKGQWCVLHESNDDSRNLHKVRHGQEERPNVQKINKKVSLDGHSGNSM